MQPIERQAISAIRVLAADAIQKANSGHPGMPIGAAPMAYALWKQMKHNPKNPGWLGRDRFVLSAGHASMLEYALLHLYGYGLTVDDLKSFRQAGSLTPGHPEYGHTTGVEATTGPLGQGFAMAVGMAMAEAHMAAKFNREGFPVVDNHTFVLMGDGCMMEGATSEAASLAGTQKLGKLIALYDSNRITIEGDTATSFAENVAARYAAYGWQVISVDNGEDVDAIGVAIDAAKSETEKPTLIIVRTNIAQGTAKQGKASAHGEPLGEENIAAMKAALGWTYDKFEVPAEVYALPETPHMTLCLNAIKPHIPRFMLNGLHGTARNCPKRSLRTKACLPRKARRPHAQRAAMCSTSWLPTCPTSSEEAPTLPPPTKRR